MRKTKKKNGKNRERERENIQPTHCQYPSLSFPSLPFSPLPSYHLIYLSAPPRDASMCPEVEEWGEEAEEAEAEE